MASDILEVLADAPDGAYAVDMDQAIVFWNLSAQRILGHRAEDVLGKQCHAVLRGTAEEDESQVCAQDCAAIQQSRQSGIPASRTVLVRTSGGERRWISTTHLLIPAEHPDLHTLVHLFHDVSAMVENVRVAHHIGDLITGQAHASSLQESPAAVTPGGSGQAVRLSPRERDVLGLLARGYATEAIAERLVVSPTTVRNYIQHILTKLGVHNRLEAVVAALRRSLI